MEMGFEVEIRSMCIEKNIRCDFWKEEKLERRPLKGNGEER